MAHLVFKAAAALLALSATCAHGASRELTCSIVVDDAEERAAIQKNGAVVARTGKHELTVKAAGKVFKYHDKPPYDEETAGTHYRFCDRDDGFILVRMVAEDLSTGVLINEASGLVTKGGQSVQFSPDKRAYFASETPEDLDGSNWRIYTVDGRESWSGYSFFPKIEKDGGISQEAQLAHPVWSATGELKAEASCNWDQSHTWPVKLIKSGGKWDWSPKKSCPKQ